MTESYSSGRLSYKPSVSYSPKTLTAEQLARIEQVKTTLLKEHEPEFRALRECSKIRAGDLEIRMTI